MQRTVQYDRMAAYNIIIIRLGAPFSLFWAEVIFHRQPLSGGRLWWGIRESASDPRIIHLMLNLENISLHFFSRKKFLRQPRDSNTLSPDPKACSFPFSHQVLMVCWWNYLLYHTSYCLGESKEPLTCIWQVIGQGRTNVWEWKRLSFILSIFLAIIYLLILLNDCKW